MSSEDSESDHSCSREKFKIERSKESDKEYKRSDTSERRKHKDRKHSKHHHKSKSREKSDRDHIGPKQPSQSEESESNANEEAVFGPVLPPHLQKPDTFGPALPPRLIKTQESAFGPQLPPQLIKSKDSSPDSSFGPTLLPHVKSCSISRNFGPEVPDFLLPRNDNPDIEQKDVINMDDESEDDIMIGPDLSLMTQQGTSDFAIDVERRALSMRKKLTGTDDGDREAKREEWMLELPPEKAVNLGLGPRQFKRKLGPDKIGDRSVWTDTPSDKDKKESLEPKIDDRDLLTQNAVKERDKEMEKLLKKARKKQKREESLLEMHQRKMKKKAKKEAKKREKEGKPVERRPFDRNIDLQVNRFDEAQKRSILKKAQLLNDRFASGQSKFL